MHFEHEFIGSNLSDSINRLMKQGEKTVAIVLDSSFNESKQQGIVYVASTYRVLVLQNKFVEGFLTPPKITAWQIVRSLEYAEILASEKCKNQYSLFLNKSQGRVFLTLGTGQKQFFVSHVNRMIRQAVKEQTKKELTIRELSPLEIPKMLKELNELRESHIITEQEFNEKKKQLLAKIRI